MASTGLESSLKDLTLIRNSYPQVKDVEADPLQLSSQIFTSTEYAPTDKAEIDQWLITASHIAAPNEDDAKTTERLSSLNTHLSSRTTLLGSKPSIADVALYSRLAPVVKSWTGEQRTGEHGYHHIVRWLDFVQNAPLFGLKVSEQDKVEIDPTNVIFYPKPVDQKAEKERKKKEKAAAAAAGATTAAAAGATVTTAADPKAAAKKETAATKEPKSLGDKIANAVGAEAPTEKKEKKAKQPKPQKSAAVEKPLSPCLIDLRVGHILKAIKHPEADSLYVSTIACGDAPGTENTSEYEGKIVRTVCSGLNGLIPLEEMQGRKIVAVCNLKPVKMRGILSAAMVLAASPRLAPGEVDNHAGPVELVNPPEGAEAGERIYFEGWEGEPDAVLNPKKKVWDYCQAGFTTTEALQVAFDPTAVEQLKDQDKKDLAILKTAKGLCSVKSLTGATVR